MKTIIPAFLVVDGEAEPAVAFASTLAIGINRTRHTAECDDPKVPRTRLFLCEASPATELDDDTPDPRTLEGVTCDSGSDRSAAGLIRTIAEYASSTPADEHAAVLSAFSRIHQLAEGWLRQRMALHPTAPPVQPVDPAGQQDAVDLLLHAWAKAEVTKDPDVAADTLETAFLQAKAERPGAYEAILAMHRQLEDGGAPAGGDA